MDVENCKRFLESLETPNHAILFLSFLEGENEERDILYTQTWDISSILEYYDRIHTIRLTYDNGSIEFEIPNGKIKFIGHFSIHPQELWKYPFRQITYKR